MSEGGRNICFFRRFDHSPMCMGRIDPCHLIPKQRIKQAGQAQYANDPRIIVPGCRRHHDRFDGRDAIHRLVLLYADYPDSVKEWAREHGWMYVGAREGWVKEQ